MSEEGLANQLIASHLREEHLQEKVVALRHSAALRREQIVRLETGATAARAVVSEMKRELAELKNAVLAEADDLKHKVERLERQLAASKERETSLWRACNNWETACQIWESRAELLEERNGAALRNAHPTG